MSKILVKFYSDWGRIGELEGLFICEKKDLASIMGKNIYFGEAFGIHSDVEEVMEESMFKEFNVDNETLDVLEKEIGSTLSGLNPVEMYEDQ